MNNIEELSLATDGIFSFQSFDIKDYETTSGEAIIRFLLEDKSGNDTEKMLSWKLLRIEENWGLRPMDDLGIVRVIF